MSHHFKNVLFIISAQVVIHILPVIMWYNYFTKPHVGDAYFTGCFLCHLFFSWISIVTLVGCISEYKERGSLIDDKHPKYIEWLEKNKN